jgi:hypothetical protein
MADATAVPSVPGDRISLAVVAGEGFYTGLIGAAIVIVVFLIHDLFSGRALLTPSLLGSLVFRGAAPPDPMAIDLPMAIAFNGLHIVTFILIGWCASLAVHVVERRSELWYLLAIVVLGLLFAGFILDAALGVPGLGRFHLWAGGVLAVLGMALYLWARHPRVLPAAKGLE